MNKIIILIIGIFVMAGLVYALATFTVTGGDLRVSSLQKGLVGHWALDGESLNNITNRTTDKTPYSNHGTVYGATLTTDQMGQGNRAMYFSSDYIDIDDGDHLDLSDELTISIWLYPDAEYVGYAAHPVNKWTSTTDANFVLYYFGTDSGTSRMVKFYANRSSVWGSISDAYYLSLNTWYHVALVRTSAAGGQLYINGEPQGVLVGSGALETNSDYLTIGTNFPGKISDVRIYNHALSADEIDTLYHSYRPKVASGSLQKGLVLDMPLNSKYTKDETAGLEVMTDRTPYSNDGQNNGSTVGSSYTDFDGNDYIDLPNDLGYSSQVSAFVWFKSSGSPPGNYHIIFGGQELEISVPVAGQIRTGVYTNLRYVSNHGSGLTDGEWHHVGFTFNGTKKESYIDGDYVGGMDVSGDLTSSFSYRRIGRFGSSSTYYTNGSISSVKIYNRVLSPSEINLLYDKGR